MTEFMSWETIGTVVGFVTSVILLTEFLKYVPIIKKVPTQIVSFVVAMIVMVAYKFAVGEFKMVDALLYVLNSVGASLTSNGGYDVIKRFFLPDQSIEGGNDNIDV